MYASADRGGELPVIEPCARNFNSAYGSMIHVPVFKVVDWGFWEANVPAPPVPLRPISAVAHWHRSPPAAPAAKPAARAERRNDDMDDDIPSERKKNERRVATPAAQFSDLAKRSAMKIDVPRHYHDTASRVHALDIRAVAHALGGDVIGRDRVAAPGPGHTDRDRSLTVTLDANAPDGFICFSHAGDPWDVCKDYVRERLGLPQWQPGDGRDRRVEPSRLRAFDRAAVNVDSERRERTQDDLIRIGRAQAIWHTATDPRGTLAEEYLASRALSSRRLAGTVLRFHPRTPWRDENTGATIFLPALIAAFRSIDDDAITAIHRIRLDQPERWPKTDRLMLGIVRRSCREARPATEVLHIGEGIETCMAARQLGYAPAWALGSAGMIAHFPVIDGVNTLRILGERCAANASAVDLCARRWHAAGRKVQVGLPKDERDKDFNDQVMREAS